MEAAEKLNLQGLAELRGKEAASLQSDNVLADDSGARRLASALRSQPWSINFRRIDGTWQASETGQYAGSTLCSKVTQAEILTFFLHL